MTCVQGGRWLRRKEGKEASSCYKKIKRDPAQQANHPKKSLLSIHAAKMYVSPLLFAGRNARTILNQIMKICGGLMNDVFFNYSSPLPFCLSSPFNSLFHRPSVPHLTCKTLYISIHTQTHRVVCKATRRTVRYSLQVTLFPTTSLPIRNLPPSFSMTAATVVSPPLI